MTATTTVDPATVGFGDPRVLRRLLLRQFNDGHRSWRDDPDAEALMRYTIQRYTPLARRYGRDPADAATAAYEAMLNPATLAAENPWAVITHAVRVTFIAEDRARALLCSPARARRADYSHLPDAHRLADDHPPSETGNLAGRDSDTGAVGVGAAAARVLVCLGWPDERAEPIVDYVCGQLVQAGSRPTAYARLRRDTAVRVKFNLTQDRWIALLRLVLGHPRRDGSAGQGVLAVLAGGATVTQVIADPTLRQIARAATPEPWEFSRG